MSSTTSTTSKDVAPAAEVETTLTPSVVTTEAQATVERLCSGKLPKADLAAMGPAIVSAYVEGLAGGLQAKHDRESAAALLASAQERETAYYALRIRIIGGLTVVQGLSNRAAAQMLSNDLEPLKDSRMSQLAQTAKLLWAQEAAAGGEKGAKRMPEAKVREIAAAMDKAKAPEKSAALKMAQEGKAPGDILRTLKAGRRTGEGVASGRGSNRGKKTGKDVLNALREASDALTNGATLTDAERAEVGRILGAISRKAKVRPTVENSTGAGTTARA